MTAAPIVKGWCPGAHRPMMSGDGLIVRVRPKMSRLSAVEADTLAGLSLRFGNGFIDLTLRGNLQVRGIAEPDHAALLDALLGAGLLDATPELEAKRNILVTPFDDEDGTTERLHDQIVAQLESLPELPAKMGIALDTGPKRMLADAPADFRFETGAGQRLILRADGAHSGIAVETHTAVDALRRMADWFVESGGRATGRMGRHLQVTPLPKAFQGAAHVDDGAPAEPGQCLEGFLVGAAFGSIEAQALQDLLRQTKATGLRVTPWRMFVLEGVSHVAHDAFVTTPQDARLSVHACPGAPMCSQAEAETRRLACAVALRIGAGTRVHVSGCAKGCAHPKPADLTFVGSNGKFDLVRAGAAWDEPDARGLTRDAILKDVVQS